MKRTQTTLSLALVLLAGACAAPGDTTPMAAEAGPVARGKAVATAQCSQCHAIGAEGASPAPAAPRWRELVMVRDVDGLAESFAEGSFVHTDGPVQMPEFTMAPAEIDDLIAYMKSLRPA